MVFFASDNLRRCSRLIYWTCPGFRISSSFVLAIILSLVTEYNNNIGNVYADTSTSDSTLSISPSATAGTTITASDENSRNSTISTWANSHDHDLDNTTNFGDGGAGNKSLCADAADTTDLCIRYNDTLNVWEAQENSTTFSTFLVFSGTNTLTGVNRILLTNGASPALTDSIIVGGSGITATVGTNSVTWDFDGSELSPSLTFSSARLGINDTSPLATVVVGGHQHFSATAPTVGSCGTSPSIVGTDNAGKITVGSSSATECAVDFATDWTNAPACTMVNETTEQTFRVVSTTTGVRMVSTTDFANDSVAYLCFGRE